MAMSGWQVTVHDRREGDGGVPLTRRATVTEHRNDSR